jgi:glycosyltransferase involved in cell wall biosynthesis
MISGKKRKLCILVGAHWAARIGGAQYQIKCLLDELGRTDDFDITYLTRRTNPLYQPVGYKIIRLSEGKGIKRHGFFFDTSRLMKSLREIQPDVIYQRTLSAYTGIAAYYAKKNNSSLVWHIAHDHDVSPPISKMEKSMLIKLIDRKIGEYGIRNSNFIIAQTEKQKKLLEQNYERRATAIISNFHPLPSELIEKRLPIKIVWVANFKPMKRPELFVRLAKDLSNIEKIDFIMIGRAGSRDRYRNMCNQIDKMKNLKYLGECSIDEVNRILAQAHIFVNTSVAEGFPNTFIQAWMRKVPVVSLDVSTDSILQSNQIGLSSRSYEEMRNNVLKLIRDPDLRATLGERAQEYAYKNHSMENAKSLVSLFLS